MPKDFKKYDKDVDDAEVLEHLAKPDGSPSEEPTVITARPSKVMPKYWVFLSREAKLKFLTFQKSSVEQRHVVRTWMVEQATKHGVRRKHIHEWIDRAVLWAFTPSKREVDNAILERSDFVKERREQWERGYRRASILRIVASRVLPGWVDPNPPVALGPRQQVNLDAY